MCDVRLHCLSPYPVLVVLLFIVHLRLPLEVDLRADHTEQLLARP